MNRNYVLIIEGDHGLIPVGPFDSYESAREFAIKYAYRSALITAMIVPSEVH
jgi:hypothetical protein